MGSRCTPGVRWGEPAAAGTPVLPSARCFAICVSLGVRWLPGTGEAREREKGAPGQIVCLFSVGKLLMVTQMNGLITGQSGLNDPRRQCVTVPCKDSHESSFKNGPSPTSTAGVLRQCVFAGETVTWPTRPTSAAVPYGSKKSFRSN